MSAPATPSVKRPACGRRPVAFLAALLVVAGGLRALYLWDNLTHSPFSQLLVLDSAHYDLWAVDIARGDWLGEEVFIQAPLYPYLLGTLYALVGRRLWLVYGLQHLLGLVNVWLVWRLGRRWFDDRVALVGAALFALYAFPVFLEGKVLVTTLYVTWSLLALDLASRVAEQGRWRWAALLGLVLGLASVTRANGLVLTVLVAGWLVWVLRRRGLVAGLGRTALVVAIAGGVVVPVTVRNWVVADCFVPISAGGGVAFARSNVLGGRGGFEPAPELPDSVIRSIKDVSALAEAELGRKPTAPEVSAFWVRRTLATVREKPGAWLRLEGWKALRVLDNYEHGTENALSEERWLTPTLWAFFVPAGVILAFGFVGLAAGVGQVGERALLSLYVVVSVLGMLAFAVVGRYRLPMMPVLALFAGQALTWLWASLWRRQWRTGLAWATPAAALLVVSFVQPDSVYERQTVRVWLNLAVTQQLADQHDEAIETAGNILTLYGDVGRAYLIRGRSFVALDHRREAESDLRQALRLMPDSSEPAQCLALLLVESGRAAEALPLAERATRLEPEHGFTWSLLAGSYLQLGRLQEAEENFRRALAVDFDLVAARLGLAQTLFAAGRYAEALPLYQQLQGEELSDRLRTEVEDRLQRCQEEVAPQP